MAIALLVGLGNPGARYTETRHNAGFWLLDALAAREGVSFSAESRFNGELAKVVIAGRDVRLLKPATFMNHSGQSVGAVARYFNLAPEQILVAHDEIDLPTGVMRLKTGGGHAGHNGLRDIVAHLSSNAFHRVRIGVGRPQHPNEKVVDYVLHKPGQDERISIDRGLDAVIAELPEILSGNLEKSMQRLHTTDE